MLRDVRPRLAAVLALSAAVSLGGCEYPRDAGGTLEHVRGGTLRVGATESDAWVVRSPGGLKGAEVRLVEQLAASLGARVAWTEGSEGELMKALQLRELDLVVGGIERTAPWDKEASLTQPYFTERVVIASRTGRRPPSEDLQGVPVAVEGGTEEAGLLEVRKDAPVVRVADVAEAQEEFVAAHDWQLPALGLQDTGIMLSTTEHVVAVPLGENAWQLQVERFLLDREPAEVARLLEEASS